MMKHKYCVSFCKKLHLDSLILIDAASICQKLFEYVFYVLL